MNIIYFISLILTPIIIIWGVFLLFFQKLSMEKLWQVFKIPIIICIFTLSIIIIYPLHTSITIEKLCMGDDLTVDISNSGLVCDNTEQCPLGTTCGCPGEGECSEKVCINFG